METGASEAGGPRSGARPRLAELPGHLGPRHPAEDADKDADASDAGRDPAELRGSVLKGQGVGDG